MDLYNQLLFKWKFMRSNSGSNIHTNKIYKYAGEIAEAIDYCHQKGIAHLNIKPSNMFIDSFVQNKTSGLWSCNNSKRMPVNRTV